MTRVLTALSGAWTRTGATLRLLLEASVSPMGLRLMRRGIYSVPNRGRITSTFPTSMN